MMLSFHPLSCGLECLLCCLSESPYSLSPLYITLDSDGFNPPFLRVLLKPVNPLFFLILFLLCWVTPPPVVSSFLFFLLNLPPVCSCLSLNSYSLGENDNEQKMCTVLRLAVCHPSHQASKASEPFKGIMITL
jgi:hypothetical protein